ncbi:MAG TPA: type IV secretion protein Rhs [Cyanobacteria bacterium UBA8543]|nr:type IV secretion protein Rhs [Cyanobacteria bacterium UBA8543]
MNNLFDVFISYGRADSKAFATKLHARLVEQGLIVWFDQNDIPLGVDYQNQIDDGIEKAYNFLFIIAPHSVNSPYCLKEIELAIKRNKRIIPVLHVMQISQETWQQRNPNGTTEDWQAYQAKGLHESYQNMHPTLRKINWVYFQEGINDFEESLAGLIKLLGRQADYVEQHTRFLARALEWERHQKQTSYLLVGEENQEAQSWLKIRFKDEQPPCVPTDLHCEFITESIKNANNLMTQVFLSYSEPDRLIMEKIRNSLRRESITVWTNKTDIQTGEAFEEAIKRGIEQADNLVYLLSPDSLNSSYCQQELDYALSLHKRIIPVLMRTTDPMFVPPALRALQYIDLTDNVQEDDYRLDESQLLKILYQDAAYYNEHKVLLVKALKWKQQQCNPSILLRGYNLRSAETWLKVANKRTEYLPTALQEQFITESLRQPPATSLDVFISYSRADSDFARKLNEVLQTQGKTTWFDQESIASGSDFQQEICQGIKVCDNFLFILSPRSVNSPYCASEVEYAAKLNKRFVTVLHREVHPENLHRELAKVQWIDFNQSGGDFSANFNQLVRTLDTDREHVHNHTKWLQQAIEWEEKDKSADLLLRGSEFAIAQNWLLETEQEKKQPSATDLQKQYIKASQEAIEAARTKAKRQVIILRSLLGLVSAAFIVSIGVLVFAFSQWRRAEIAQIKSLGQYSLSLSDSNRQFDGLIEAIRAGSQLQKQNETDSVVLTALQKAVYGVRERNRLMGHTSIVYSVTFSPDGSIVASASDDATVKLWSQQGKLLHTLRHDDTVRSVVFSPDGSMIASASDDKTVKLWNQQGKLLYTLGHNAAAKSVVFSPDGSMIASASDDKTAKLWSKQGQLLYTLEHNAAAKSVVFSPDGSMIASASDDKTVKLWNQQGKLLYTLEHNAAVKSVVFSPDGSMIASASADKTVKLWSKQGQLLHTLEHNAGVTSVAFSPDGRTIASASADATVKLWNQQGQLLHTLRHGNWVYSVVFSPKGTTIASASADKTVKLWSQQGQLLYTLPHGDEVRSVVFSSTGLTIASASDDKTIKLWSRQRQLHTLAHSKTVYSVAFSPDSSMIASASADKTVKLWSKQGRLLHTLGHGNAVRSVVFSPDGSIIASASTDKTVKLWSKGGRLLHTLPHGNAVHIVVFSPDSSMIASASADKTVKLWSKQGRLLHTIGHGDVVTSVAFSPDGSTIASGSADRTVKLWSQQGQLLHTIGHRDVVRSVVFSPDGSMIASGSADRTVKLWSQQGQLLHTLKHHDVVRSVVFSPDGSTIASANDDNTVKLWSKKGQELQTLIGHKDQIWSVVFSPDGKMLASASFDRTGRLWNLADFRLDQLMGDACDWVGDYLKYNSEVEESDRHLCDGIGTRK